MYAIVLLYCFIELGFTLTHICIKYIPGDPSTISSNQFSKESPDFTCSSIFLLENMYFNLTLSKPNSQEIGNSLPIYFES